MAKRWGIKVDGQTFFVEDLTLAECRRVEQATGQSWRLIDPLRSAAHASALLTCFLARGSSVEAATAKVDAMRMDDALDLIDLVDDEDDRPIEHTDGIPVVDPFPGTAAPATTG